MKQPDLPAPTRKPSVFQATIESADDEETGTKGKEKTVKTEARSGSMNYREAGEVVGKVDDASDDSEASDSTDDTFLPTDSISNVGVSTTAHAPDLRFPQPVFSTARPDQLIDGRLDEGKKKHKVKREPRSTKSTTESKPRTPTKDSGISEGIADSRERLFNSEVRTADPRYARVKQEPIVPKLSECLDGEPIRYYPRWRLPQIVRGPARRTFNSSTEGSNKLCDGTWSSAQSTGSSNK
jgi:hypothetical protein